MPTEVIRAKCSPYLHHGKPIRRTERTVDTAFSIVAQFQAEFRGVAEYYKLAYNRHRLGRFKYVMERSLTRHWPGSTGSGSPQVYQRFRAVLDTEHGPRRGLRVTVDRETGSAAGSAVGRDQPGAGPHTDSPQRRPAQDLESTAGQNSYNGSWPTAVKTVNTVVGCGAATGPPAARSTYRRASGPASTRTGRPVPGPHPPPTRRRPAPRQPR